MNKQTFHLNEYDWAVTLYYNVAAQDFYAVMSHLWLSGCRGDDFRSAWNNVNKGCCNRGLTYSNFESKESIVIVGKASSFGELMNSLSHEIHHLSVHIALANDLELDGEGVCYIDGSITQMVFEIPISGTTCSIPTNAVSFSPLSPASYKWNPCRTECKRTIR